MTPRRFAVLPRLGMAPSTAEVVRERLDAAIEAAERHSPGAVTALDAGCGRVSALRPYKPRIARLVGADLHAPAPGALAHLDAFVTADLCAEPEAFPPASFDVVLSSFTVEHFVEPDRAFTNLATWLRPGGRLVITTVNRRHPFVRAYLAIPGRLRAPIQRLVKATAADAHPLVGACNSPALLETALTRAGFAEIETTTVSHLARAWGRTWPTWLLGLAGDLLTRSMPSRRSTIVVSAAASGRPRSSG